MPQFVIRGGWTFVISHVTFDVHVHRAGGNMVYVCLPVLSSGIEWESKGWTPSETFLTHGTNDIKSLNDSLIGRGIVGGVSNLSLF